MTEPTDTKPATVETLRTLADAFNQHDLAVITEYFSEECMLSLPRGTEPGGLRLEGNERVRSGRATRFEGVPDVRYGDDRHWMSESGEFGVSEWHPTGTSPEGDAIEVGGNDHLDLENGKMIHNISYWKIVEE